MSSRSSAMLVASLVGLSLLAAVPPAEAQRKPAASAKKPGKNDPKLAEAKRYFQQGEEFYSKGDYEKAIEAWEKSYELSQKDLILESIANAYERLGEAEKARDYLAKWREAAPADEHADLDARIAKLDERVAKQKAEQAERDKAEADRIAREKKDAEQREKNASGKLFLPGVILAGVGGAAAIGGGVLDILAATKRPDASLVCGTTPDGKQLCRTSARDDIESSNTFATVGDIMLIAGGVTAAVGVVLVITQSNKKNPEDTKTAIAPWFLPGGGGIVAGGRF